MAAQHDSSRLLTLLDIIRQATLAQSVHQSAHRALQRSVSPSDRTSNRTLGMLTNVSTPPMLDANLRRLVDNFVHSVEQDLTSLHMQHITRHKAVKIDPASVPLPDSDTSRSSAPVQWSTPSLMMKRARESGHFSSEELRMSQNAFNASTSLPPTQDPIRPAAH